MTWICPQCHQSNSDDSVICACGHMDGRLTGSESTPNLSAREPVGPLKTCPSCNKEVPLDDKFCAYCGKSTVVLTEKEKKKIRKASNWIFAISIMFIIFGTIMGFMQKSVAENAHRNLAQFEDAHVWETPINGKNYTVGELRTQIDREVVLVFLTNYFLAAIMFGLFLWARRAPFPAMVTALCVYLAVIVLNGIVDPKSLVQGIIVKIIFISALVAGIKTSLVARGVSRTQLEI